METKKKRKASNTTNIKCCKVWQLGLFRYDVNPTESCGCRCKAAPYQQHTSNFKANSHLRNFFPVHEVSLGPEGRVSASPVALSSFIRTKQAFPNQTSSAIFYCEAVTYRHIVLKSKLSMWFFWDPPKFQQSNFTKFCPPRTLLITVGQPSLQRWFSHLMDSLV